MNGTLRNVSLGFSALGVLTFLVGYTPASRGFAHEPQLEHFPIHLQNGATSAYQQGYTPSQIRSAYGLAKLSATGSGTTVAIIEAYGSPTIRQDLATFDRQFNLPKARLEIAYPTGKPMAADSGWALETSMDAEWVHAIAPDAKILLVVAQSTNDLLSAVNFASSRGVDVVSMSWGGPEFSGESSYDSYFNHPGIVYVASSGDNGSGVRWPAVSPYVLGVGGTTLNLTADGKYQSETAWPGSGGGVSSVVSRPDFQDAVSSVVGQNRGVPDVAWDGDPTTGVAVYDSTPIGSYTGWLEVGGTSLGAPSWAGLVADADSGLTSPYDSIRLLSALYRDMGHSSFSPFFHEISGTTGNNSYDVVTGLGTPIANTLLPRLVEQGGGGRGFQYLKPRSGR
ncbi:S53 family peptidase [Alicyclobacillus tolerans]|uniref:S53 family peptidase n=1 Tax=Alicyclobacillus tolerans TaxID=90970 RepID=UPI001F3A1880|nr:S53 family peptidase [Alicyclobacillus tolerans]MCF8567138.1 S53 family peptidase [Alicyclobacillus tolerans]